MPGAAFNLRMPDPLKARVREAARENKRSINSEIIYRLQRSFEAYKNY
jgi:predicted HicB family RNase H-like nuclease